MRHGSLFSGIGGLDLAAEWMGWENVFHCEWMEFPRKVLDFYWPDADSHIDICKTDFTKYANKIDILTGGFPCQPYSNAGKRKGKEDDRHLWPEMLRAIQEIKPRWVVGENVLGLVNWNDGLVFQEVCLDLEAEGYEVQPFILPAASKGAPHSRQRVWFIAFNDSTPNSYGLNQRNGNNEINTSQGGINALGHSQQSNGNGTIANTKCIRLEHGTTSRQIPGENGNAKTERNKSTLFTQANDNGHQPNWDNFPTQSPICSGDDGLPTELDGITFSKWRNESIKGYGNAIVPQVAHTIFQTIEQYERPI